MTKLIFRKPIQLFISIFLPFLLSIILLILFLSFALYINFENIALEMEYNFMKSDLQSISRSASVMLETARSLAKHVYFDETISDMFYSEIKDIEYTKCLNKLSAFRNINPFIYSIQIYNEKYFYVSPSYNFIYPKSSFIDTGIIDILENMKEYKSNSVIPRRIPELTGLQDDSRDASINVYSYLFYDSQMHSEKISEAIILNIYEKTMRENINAFSNNNNKRIFIIDSRGTLITDDVKYPMLHNMSDQEYIKQILISNKNSGNIRAKVDNVDSFITYVSTDVIDWKFISIIPYSHIMQKINSMKIKTYIFVILILIVGIILSLYISRRLYIPVRTTLLNLDELESERRSYYHNRKQDFLKSIIKSTSCNTEIISKKFNSLNVNLNISGQFLILFLRIDKYIDFCNEYNLEDRGILKFGSMNIISEIFSKGYQNECIDMGEDYIIVLVNYTDSLLPSRNNVLKTLINEIQISVRQYLKYSISITVSEMFVGIDSLNIHYSKTLELSYYRYILGHECEIYPENIEILNIDDYKYPIDAEKLLIDSLMLGHMSEVKKTFTEIIQDSLNYGQSIINTTVLRLLISINNSIDILHRNNGLTIDYNFDMFLTKYRKAETLSEIQTMFFNLFDSILDEIELRRDSKYDRIIEDIVGIIEREYMNSDLSLESLADIAGISPSYLSRLFKNNKLLSINDYINNVRIEKAKEMLLESKKPVNIIMEQTGFLSRSHFYTLFKKLCGVTPNQFRQGKILLKDKE